MRVHHALGDGAQETRAVGEPDRHLTVGQHRQRGRERGHRLRHGRVHAAVHEAGWLLELVAHLDLGAHVGVRAGQELEPVEAVEPPKGAVDLRGTGCGHPGATIA